MHPVPPAPAAPTPPPLADTWKMQCNINIVIINFHKQFRFACNQKIFWCLCVRAFAPGIGLYIRLPTAGSGSGLEVRAPGPHHDIYNN